MQNLIKKTLRVEGMTCVSCENRIENKLKKAKGIVNVKASYSKETVTVTFDVNIIKLSEIEKMIGSLDYKVVKSQQDDSSQTGIMKVVGIAVVIFSVYMLLRHFGLLNIFNSFPEAEAGMSYGMLFVIGLLTSLHCVAMCGGINLSQCVPQGAAGERGKNKFANLKPSFLYNTGRVISYTVIGAFVGTLGKAVSFSGGAKGVVQLIAGVFMVIMGLNMLHVFPWLRKFSPRMPKIFARRISGEKARSNSPFYVGLLNGLMPCGPLQVMQLYALSTGSPFKGALSMFLFSVGTVPLMFGLGALSSFLSKKFTAKMMTVSAVLVIMLGVSMFSSGVSLSGFTLSGASGSAKNTGTAQIENGVQKVTTSLSSGRYEPITVQAGMPVQWTIRAEQGTINGCNNRIIIPEYNNLEKKLEVGDNVIEFTPEKTGTFPYSCWMGMIRSSITVVDNTGSADKTTAKPDAAVEKGTENVNSVSNGTGDSCCK